MKKISKLREERELRIKERLYKLSKWEAYEYLLTHLRFAEDNKDKEKAILNIKVESTNDVILEIKRMIKILKKFVPNVLEQNVMTAIYLLISKSFFDLEALLVLTKSGFSFQTFDITRNAIESLDLIFLFTDESDNVCLRKWFKGEIIGNSIARDSADKVMNSGAFGKIKFPVQELKRDIYDVYSGFTHSSYGSILDLIDPYHKDLDFQRLTGYHYSLKYFDTTILNLEFNILLALKNIFILLSDEKTINEIDNLLIQFDKLKARKFELSEVLKNYN